MVEEFYPADLVERSQALYEEVKRWAIDRGQITVIGGWAVYEHVDPVRAQRSRDLDLVFRSEARLQEFADRMPDWDLTWKTSGRRTFKACRLEGGESGEILVDIYTTGVFWRGLFGRQAAQNVKSVPNRGSSRAFHSFSTTR